MPSLTMLYRLEVGPIAESSYGIALARAMGFPATFIARAEEVAAAMRARAAARKQTVQARRTAAARRLIFKLVDALKALAEGTVADDAELGRRLRALQNGFTMRMNEINEAGTDQAEEEPRQYTDNEDGRGSRGSGGGEAPRDVYEGQDGSGEVDLIRIDSDEDDDIDME